MKEGQTLTFLRQATKLVTPAWASKTKMASGPALPKSVLARRRPFIASTDLYDFAKTRRTFGRAHA